MKKIEVKFVLLVFLSFLVTTPSYARGFSGGFSGGFGGGHFGGGMSSSAFHGSNFGSGGLRNSGFRNSGSDGGFRNSGFGDGGFRNSGFSDGGFRNGGFRNLPTDGGFGKISGLQNRNPQKLSQNDLSNQGKSVRDSFNNNNLNKTTNNQFNQYNYNRYGRGYGYGAYGYHPYGYGGYGWGYPAAWYPAGLTASMWTCAGMESLDTFLGLAALENNSSKSSQPASSNNVVYEGDNVYIDGQPGVTAEQYYQQSQQLALAGQDNSQYTDSTNSSGGGAQWQPLGVFALAEPGQSQSSMLLQLAIDKNGIVHGNYYNQLTNESAEIYGSLDKKTQRVSWTIGTNPNTVFDAGLGDLVKDDSSVLVHYGSNNTSRMALIRLQQPPQDTSTS